MEEASKETPTNNDTSKIVFCKIEYGKLDQGGNSQDRCGGAVFSSNVSKLIISNCLLQNNRVYNIGDIYTGSGGAIALDNASPIISNNCIRNNTSFNHVGGGIMCYNQSHPIISNNVIANNRGDYGGGLAIYMSCRPIVTNNIIVENQARQYGGGLRCYQVGNQVLINNTIAMNSTAQLGGGVSCVGSDPVFINTILYGNMVGSGDQVHLMTTDSDPDFYYCNIEGGSESFAGEGAGIDSIEIGRTWYYAPTTDIDGNQRPDPAGSAPDIGAFENALGDPATSVGEVRNQHPQTCLLMQNYPNPFNPVTHIKYQLHKDTHVCIKILNALCQEVETIIDEKKSAGHYTISWDASNNASGLYFVSLKADEYYNIRKMLLIR
ncbi:MAG: right-handed parallel beta-helix repeat-containing protein [bacterium]|nr:MAG: right-handed parallel beta-helix repeat-containing protein [bacterium]